jgi:hypothetical protein
VIEVRNDSGVLLRYDTEIRQPPRVGAVPSDRLNCLLRRASGQARYLRIMIERIEDELSEVAIDRFGHALHTIEAALDRAREEMQ